MICEIPECQNQASSFFIVYDGDACYIALCNYHALYYRFDAESESWDKIPEAEFYIREVMDS